MGYLAGVFYVCVCLFWRSSWFDTLIFQDNDNVLTSVTRFFIVINSIRRKFRQRKDDVKDDEETETSVNAGKGSRNGSLQSKNLLDVPSSSYSVRDSLLKIRDDKKNSRSQFGSRDFEQPSTFSLKSTNRPLRNRLSTDSKGSINSILLNPLSNNPSNDKKV